MVTLIKTALILGTAAILAVPQAGFESDYAPAATEENGLEMLYQLTSQSAVLAPNPSPNSKTAYLRGETYKVAATAYTSVPEQTDDSPFITASGTYARDGVIAANFLPLGTAIKIPELFGDKLFVVEDRMHPRNNGKIDIWLPTIEEAKRFGTKIVKIVVL
jgi:3D (Asp-Asp-Asp) domain-containing protein